ncbi:MAG: hypothetical protein ABUS79_19190 [Pseudomonadota bacterium]
MNGPRAVAAFWLLLPIACTTAVDQHGYLPPPANGGATGHMPSGTVAVTITEPANPTTLGIHSDLVVRASAAVQGGSDYIDTSSVAVVVTAPASSVVLANGVLVSTGGDAYAGTLSLGDLPAGTYTLTVSAKSSSGTQASDHISLTVDAGPVITVLSPVADHGYNGGVAIDVTVDPGAFALASGPTATIAGKPIALTPPDANQPSYRATVIFGPTANPPAGAILLPDASGKQLFQVQATNTIGVTGQARVVFVVDKSGPTITATTPVSGDIVGGLVNISATVTDDSGVLDSSVVAVISNQETPIFELPLAAQGSGIYGVLFDTSNLTRCPEPPSSGLCVVFPNISFRAVDLVGNQSVLSYGFSVDNVAPVADLDPPMMRQRSLTTTGYQCSFAFDPLSVNQEIGDMPDDGCVVPQVFDLRARIEDDGNRASELKVTPISLVDPDNTNVFIMPASVHQPLVVDSDGDGRCDEVNPLLTPISPTAPPTPGSGVLQVRLAAVPPTGRADFEPDPTLPATAPCGEGTATAPPPRLCGSFQQPTLAIGYSDNQPAIWSVEPVDKTFHCFGNQLDTYANKIPEGWACIAVQTRDKVGNQSVSVPMRVYVEYDATGGHCPLPPAGAGPPPTCTGTYDPTAKQAVIGACSARSFPKQLAYYCAPGDC